MAPDNCTNFSAPDEIHIQVDDQPVKKDAEPIFTNECCIYKVPEILRKENEDAYTPLLISIGPIHHRHSKLKKMEEQKFLYFNFFCDRVGDVKVGAFTKYLKENDSKIRDCYSEKYTDLNTDDFVQMIRLDAVFIMELFLRKYDRDNEKDDENIEGDYMFNQYWLYKVVQRDLLLEENQIPFEVLEELYKHLKIEHHKDGFLGLARRYFETYDPYKVKPVEEINKNKLLTQGWDKPKHFTDLIRFFHIPRNFTFGRSEHFDVNDAAKLKSAGIIFKPAVDKACLLDLTLKKERFLDWLPFLSCLPYLDCVKAHLLFPQLTIDDSTEYVFRNLMAFEQCHYSELHYVCSYARLLDKLIGEENDAAVLIESGVIVNQLSSEEELTILINKLCKNIAIKTPGYGCLSEKLHNHYKDPWNKTVAELRLVYFSNLWKGSGTILALVALFITLFNFIRSNIEYFS